MRVQLISDLHLERYPDFTPQAAAHVDLLVLAGDIGSYQAGSLLQTDDFGLGRFSPLQPHAPWRQVLYVPGNHEFDGLDFDDACAKLRSTCDRLGITWLDQEVVVIGGVRFVGTTLWSDFDALAKSEQNLSKALVQRDKAYRAANHYLRKNTTLRQGAPMLAEDLRALSIQCQAWLEDALAVPFDGPTVVVTHFAPSLHSADPRYGITPGTAGFCNDLSKLLPLADVWMHGHLHCLNDYRIPSRHEAPGKSCRVVANPRGYASKGEQATYIAHFVIDINTERQLQPQTETELQRG